MKTLSIIGCGHVGKTLARLWTEQRTLQILDICNRTPASAQRAVDFIGTGRAVAACTSLRPADIYLISTPDDRIADSCRTLAATGCLSENTIVFHCSGALSSHELASAAECGARVASIHPLRSFAAPESLVHGFSGTFCGVEGDPRALACLGSAFTAIGAQFVPINGEAKILYHAAAVFACNYLTTLLHVAQQTCIQAGVPADTALQLLSPLVRETVDNVFRLGPAQALTGPIARGDMITVEKQQHAISSWNENNGNLYAQFAKLTVELARLRN